MGNSNFKQFTPWGRSSISDPSSTTTVTTKTSEYILSKTPIGEGSYSVVYKCQNKSTKKLCASKKYKKLIIYGMEDSLVNEFEILKSITKNHPKLLSLIDYFETDKSFYLVTDLAKGGDLFNKIVNESPNGKLDIDTSQEIIVQLIDCLAFLHENGIVHRDMKPENIFFKSKDSNSILLGDFGLARSIKSNQKLYEISGTLSYMAPEMFDREKGYSKEIDIWAMGVVLYFMLSGYLPFDCETDDETKDAITNKKYLFEPEEYWEDTPKEIKQFINSCFERNTARRSLATLKKEPFVSQYMPPSISKLNSNSKSTNSSSSSSIRPNISSLQKKQIMDILSNNKNSRLKAANPKMKNFKTDENTHQGDMCHSPETVTELNTPSASVQSSREPSSLKIPQYIDEINDS
ncbi:hypothetical protein KGF54_003701 [Candida jiufengensis]|uniref:uncharacterized protein n=1 Tax=Candida jiufengensis TaxID=497108 RepID=UPI0022257CE0|nr:uncharacterized protein KGF54_003701 [Candida jiufengensis]KAI5952834.1 hypothetical protein KGF54_003701 [Candida jiufengensis]